MKIIADLHRAQPCKLLCPTEFSEVPEITSKATPFNLFTTEMRLKVIFCTASLSINVSVNLSASYTLLTLFWLSELIKEMDFHPEI